MSAAISDEQAYKNCMAQLDGLKLTHSTAVGGYNTSKKSCEDRMKELSQLTQYAPPDLASLNKVQVNIMPCKKPGNCSYTPIVALGVMSFCAGFFLGVVKKRSE